MSRQSFEGSGGRFDYDTSNIHEVYDSARSLPPETLNLWMDALSDSLTHPVAKIMDLGCGTGRFSSELARKFDALVWGIDPSSRLLAVAEENPGKDHRVQFKMGSAEDLPIVAPVDLIFLSMVYHHLEDKADALNKIEKSLAHPGSLAIRTATQEDIRKNELFSFFPTARDLELSRMPEKKELLELASSFRFSTAKAVSLEQSFSDSYLNYYKKVEKRGLSALRQISDSDFAVGLELLREYCMKSPNAGPVVERYHLFVFSRR